MIYHSKKAYYLQTSHLGDYIYAEFSINVFNGEASIRPPFFFKPRKLIFRFERTSEFVICNSTT